MMDSRRLVCCIVYVYISIETGAHRAELLTVTLSNRLTEVPSLAAQLLASDGLSDSSLMHQHFEQRHIANLECCLSLKGNCYAR